MTENKPELYYTYSKENIISITKNKTAHINIQTPEIGKTTKIEFADGIFDMSGLSLPEKIIIRGDEFNIAINSSELCLPDEYIAFEITLIESSDKNYALDFRIYKGTASKEIYFGDINGIYITLMSKELSCPCICKIKAENDINKNLCAKAYLKDEYISLHAHTSAVYFYSKPYDTHVLSNISDNKMYTYSYPGSYREKNGKIQGFLGDDDGQTLTKNKKFVSLDIKNRFSFCMDQYGRQNQIGVFDDKPAHYFIRQDLGFICSTDYVDFKFKIDEKNDIPYKIDLFSSNDGVNFTSYLGEMKINFLLKNSAVYSYECQKPIKTKSFKIVIYSEDKTSNSFSSLNVYGIENHKYILLKKFCSKEHISPNIQRDDNLEHYHREIIDLGGIKNVSELVLSSFADENEKSLRRIEAEYSTDGINFTDFGISFKQNSYKNFDKIVEQYKIFREFTLKARYLKIRIFSENKFSLHDIKIYGCENEVPKPNFAPVCEYTPNNTNIALGKETDISGRYNFSTYNLTNGLILRDSKNNTKSISANHKLTLMLNLGGKNDICGFCLQSDKNTYERICGVNIYLADQNKNFKKLKNIFRDDAEYADYKLIRANFKNTPAHYIKLEIETCNVSDILNFYQLQVYKDKAHLPLITGGFICYYKNSESFNFANHHRFDEYAIYQALKGFKEQGMNTIIFSGEALDYVNKLSMLDNIPDELKNRGYKKGYGMGTADPCESTLKAADELGLDVMVGTLLAYGWWAVPETKIFDESTEAFEKRRRYFEDAAYEAELIIPYIYKKYKKYKSFKGFYLCDETCDRWMNENNGEASMVYRMLYKRQSDVIRSLDPNLKIALSPAIWRESSPELFYKNLKAMLKAENENEQPIVDIVAFQDCLGRLFEYKIPNKVYYIFEEYLALAKKALDEIGIDTWNDLEVFDIAYHSREYNEIIHAVNLESKYTRNNIVFDLPHYFSSFCKNKFDDTGFVNTDYINLSYIKHISKYQKN